MRFMTRATCLLSIGLSSCWVATAQAGDQYVADAVHSSVVFRVKHANTAYVWGRFNEISGAFSLNGDDSESVRLDFEVKTASIDTGNADRDKHLKGPDCFNAAQFPSIRFKSKSATTQGSGFEVAGELTLHGVTKPVTVRLSPTGTGKGPTGKAIGGIEATCSIKQSDFGMTKLGPMIGDIVYIIVSVEGVQK